MENFYKFGKKIFILLLLCTLSVNAADYQNIVYKNLKDGAKITLIDGVWSTKIDKKNKEYYIKKESGGLSNFSEFYSPEQEFLFSTGTQYEFIHKGNLIGYSNLDLKFYVYDIRDGLLCQRELIESEVQELFPRYKIIKVSDFSNSTNCYRIKKGRGALKIILLNDTDRSFDYYAFSSNNAKFEKYNLKSFLNITKKGMIQFSRFTENSKNYPWFVLLVR